MTLRACAVALVITAALAPAVGAQFDVATVKPTPADQQGIEQPSIVQFMSNGFRRTNSTLRTLVRTAWDVQEYQVTGGPDWADRLRFDIEARHGGNRSRGEVLQMLQALLTERFQLAVSRQTREGDTYTLVRVVGRKLPELVTDSTSASVRFGSYSGRRSMGQLAQYLASIVGRPVTDATGLAGNYEMALSFAPDLRDTERPSIFAALQEQLGLRLESSRGSVETIAIERASVPESN
jgi:uncharacterized protein (TIGR03435 family)